MMVRYLLAVANLIDGYDIGNLLAAETGSADSNSLEAIFHIIGQIATVGTRIGAELLFIEALCVV